MTTAIDTSANATTDLMRRLVLLISQGISLGLMLAFVVVTGMTLVLNNYGSQTVPYVYITVAILGSLLFYLFGEIQRRIALPILATTTLLLMTLFLALTWVGLVWAGWLWLSFIVLVSFSLFIQIGFVIIGAQAGNLLDIRAIKRYFPWIVSGFVVGFMIGGALVGPITNLNGRPEDMLLVATVIGVVFTLLIIVTGFRYRQALRTTVTSGPQQKPPPMRSLLAKRVVIMLFLYQMLSALASQILDFMVLAVSGARFTDGTELAGFFGSYTFVLNLVDLLFVLLLAGILLSRFGLRFGLTANPGVVIVILAGVVVSGMISGQTSMLFFWLVIIARITDLTMTDGTTRTSINAAYQSLQPAERASVQTAVEGIGVPVALGLAGVILLLFQAIPGVTLVHIAAFTLLVSFVWVAAGALVYRDYAGSLLKVMRRRTLEPAGLTIEDASTLAVVEKLLDSQNVSDVRLALDVLADAEYPQLDQQLIDLAQHATTDVRVEALHRIADRGTLAALSVVKASLARASAEIRGAAIRALCALQGEDGVEQITPYAADANPIVQQQALIGLLRYGGISGIVAAAEQLATLGRSTAVGDRSAAAHIIGAVGNQHFYQPLIPLLQDDSVAVRNAALIAAASAPHPNLVPLLIANLEHSVTRSAATEALIAAGKNILPPLQAALRGSTPLEPVVLTHLMRVAGSLPATAIGPLLSKHLTYPDPDLRGVIQRAALSSGYRLDQDQSGKAAMNSALELEAQTTQRILTALADLAGDDDGLQAVQRALDDALILAQQRVLLLLRLFYDSQALARVGDLLTGARGADQSLALELLDVTLIPEHKIALAVIDPQLSREKRQDRLARVADVAPASRQERLQELATDPDHVWQQGWLRACAVYAIGRIGLLTLAEAVTTLQDDADPTVRETVIWTLEQLQTTDS